jgi:hypothetical protein
MVAVVNQDPFIFQVYGNSSLTRISGLHKGLGGANKPSGTLKASYLFTGHCGASSLQGTL